jgi:hypothetical protein
MRMVRHVASIESVIVKTPEYLDNLSFTSQVMRDHMPEGTNPNSVGSCLNRMVEKEMLDINVRQEPNGVKVGHYTPTGKTPIPLRRPKKDPVEMNKFLTMKLVSEPSPTEYTPRYR